MLRKYFAIILSCLILVPAMAGAAPDIGLGGEGLASGVALGSGYDKATDTTLSESVGRVIRIIMSMVGTIFLVLTVYAGILWMTAAGNEESVEKAQSIVKAASLGLVIVIAAYGVTTLVVAAITFSGQPEIATVGGKPAEQSWAEKQGIYWQNWVNNWKVSTKSMLGIK